MFLHTRVKLNNYPQAVEKFKVWEIATRRTGFMNPELISGIINSWIVVTLPFL
jgi:hypothetical protein